jgi:hypothetical protein
MGYSILSIIGSIQVSYKLENGKGFARLLAKVGIADGPIR